jgi:hypothetical protein
MPGHPCSKLVKQERHSFIITEMAKGTPRPELVRAVRQRWGISQSQALRCLQAADLERAEIYSATDRAAVLSQCLQAAEKAVQLAIARGYPNEVVGSVRLLDNLLALGASHERRNRPWENR